MLRQLAVYHSKDPSNLFMVRLAQGLTHLGKGTLTVSPYHSDRTLMNPVAVAGLLAALVACLDVKNCKYLVCNDWPMAMSSPRLGICIACGVSYSVPRSAGSVNHLQFDKGRQL